MPHFEKMLYDNALLAAAYLHAHLAPPATTATGRWSELTLDYLLRELRLDEGMFASSLDADTDGVEGATYVWTPDDLREALGEADAGRRPPSTTASTEPGNFEGADHPAAAGRPACEPRGHPHPPARGPYLRPQPARDDKAIAAWNGLALAALAEAGERLGGRTTRMPRWRAPRHSSR